MLRVLKSPARLDGAADALLDFSGGQAGIQNKDALGELFRLREETGTNAGVIVGVTALHAVGGRFAPGFRELNRQVQHEGKVRLKAARGEKTKLP